MRKLYSLANLQAFMDTNGKVAEVYRVRIPNRRLPDGVITEDDTQFTDDQAAPNNARRLLAEYEREGIEQLHDLQVRVRMLNREDDSGFMSFPDAQVYIDSFAPKVAAA